MIQHKLVFESFTHSQTKAFLAAAIALKQVYATGSLLGILKSYEFQVARPFAVRADVLRTMPSKAIELASFDMYKKLMSRDGQSAGVAGFATSIAGGLAGPSLSFQVRQEIIHWFSCLLCTRQWSSCATLNLCFTFVCARQAHCLLSAWCRDPWLLGYVTCNPHLVIQIRTCQRRFVPLIFVRCRATIKKDFLETCEGNTELLQRTNRLQRH